MKNKNRSLVEALIFLAVFAAVFVPLGHVMGSGNLLNTIMNTAHSLYLLLSVIGIV